MAEYIKREDAIEAMYKVSDDNLWIPFHNEQLLALEGLPASDVQPVVRCKDCKHFHLDYFGEVNGANIIVAHEICDLWAGGCKTMQNAFCSNGVRIDGDNNG